MVVAKVDLPTFEHLVVPLAGVSRSLLAFKVVAEALFLDLAVCIVTVAGALVSMPSARLAYQ